MVTHIICPCCESVLRPDRVRCPICKCPTDPMEDELIEYKRLELKRNEQARLWREEAAKRVGHKIKRTGKRSFRNNMEEIK